MESSNLVDKFVLVASSFMITGDFIIHWNIEMDTGRRHLNDQLTSNKIIQKQHIARRSYTGFGYNQMR